MNNRVASLVVALILCLSLFSPGRGLAQSGASSGQVIGQVVDSSGSPVVGADISIRSKETNLLRSAISDERGRFAFALLPLHAFEVTASAPGMQRAMQEVVATLGGTAAANFKLAVAGVTESVQVDSGLHTVGGQAKAVLTELQLQNLPANGRRVRSMFQLTPGTQIEPECGGFSVSGQKGTMINVNIDGGDCTSTHWTGHLEVSPTIGFEALEELQVLRSSFSAEYGRTTGGVINMSTRSGTNQLRGSSVYFFRNDELTRVDPLGREQIDASHQFGGTLGGPLRRDRTFFFVAPEFGRVTKPVQTLYAALDSQGIRNSAGTQELLRIAPEAQRQGLSESLTLTARLDHRLTSRHTLMGRFDVVRNHAENSVGSFSLTQGIGLSSVTNRDLAGQAFINDRNTTIGMVQMQSVLSNSLVNDFRVQVFHENRPSNTNVSGPEVTVRNAGAVLGIYGPQATGLSYGNTGYTFNDTRYHVVNSVSAVTGAHTARFGVDLNLVDARSTFDPGSNGVYTFNSLTDFLARRPFQYQQFAGSGTVDTMTKQIALYVQDEWRVRPGLTVSPGFRYEMAFTPDYLPASVAPNRIPLATKIPDALDMAGPRLGLSWDPTDSGRTIFRAAGGLFYNAPYVPLYEQAIMTNGGNPELSSQVVITTTANPVAVADAFARVGIDLSSASLGSLPSFTAAQLQELVAPANRIGSTVNFIDPDFRLPRAAHARVAVERQIGNGIVASLDFTHVKTSRIARVRNLNLEPPVLDALGRPVYTNSRPFGPSFGFVNVTESSARSQYQGMTAALNVKRRQFILDMYYTLSGTKSDDDFERPVNAIFYNDAYDLASEYTWANIDQRHQFAASGLLFLPAQLEVSTTVRLNSGRPFTANAGSDLNRDGNQRDRAVIDGAVVRRNTYRNTSFSEVSVRVQRGFGLPTGARAILSVELFNLLNGPNVEVGSENMVYGPGAVLQNGVPAAQAPPSNFGRVRDANGNYLQNSVLRTTPFQAQLGVRIQF